MNRAIIAICALFIGIVGFWIYSHRLEDEVKRLRANCGPKSAINSTTSSGSVLAIVNGSGTGATLLMPEPEMSPEKRKLLDKIAITEMELKRTRIQIQNLADNEYHRLYWEQCEIREKAELEDLRKQFQSIK